MKITVKEGGKEKVFILPASLALRLFFKRSGSFCNAFGNVGRKAGAIDKTSSDCCGGNDCVSGVKDGGSSGEKSGGDMREIIRAIKAAKAQWGHLKIVEISTSDGEEITITL